MIRRFGSLLVSTVVAASVMLTAAPSAVEAAPACNTTTQATYAVTVCLTAPATGAVVSGDVSTTASVDITGTSPGVRRVQFDLDGGYLLTDFSAPYTFALPSAKSADGIHTLTATALLRDNVTATSAAITLSFANNNQQPPPLPTGFEARTTNVAHPVLAAAGDGPDGSPASDQVASLISSWNPDLALYLGDVYEKGSAAEFHNWYGATGWGQLAPITNPVVGNHEYENGQAPGYFGYWKSPPHYYAFDAGSWRVITLDSTSQFNETAKGTSQYQWLQQQLNSSPPCVMVAFHHPVYSVGPQGDTASMQDIWDLMASQGVDVVLTGHDHSYQRWTPLDKKGNPNANGITQFVVGTAGHGIQGFVRSDSRMLVGFDTSPAAFGALRLTLNPSGAGFVFADTAGTARDGGALKCSGSPNDVTAPTQVTDLAASAPLGSSVNLSWTASIDDVGISQYRIFRNGALLATSYSPSYKDLAVAPGATYQYTVVARDPAGNESAPSNVAQVTLPADGGLVFVDDFESGGLSQWSPTGSIIVDSTAAFAGQYGVRATTTGSPAYATTNLATPRTDLYYRVRFKILTRDTNSVYLQRFRTAGVTLGGSLLGLYVSSTGKLGYRNDVGGASTTSGVTVTSNSWHEVQVRLTVAGAQGAVAVWYDGAPVAALSKSEDVGTAQIGQLQMGDNAPNRTHTVLFDDVAASTGFINDAVPPPPDTTPPSAPGNLVATATAPDRVSLSWTAATDNVAVTGYDIYRVDGLDPEEGPVFLETVPASPTAYPDVVAPATTYSYTVRARDAAGNVGPAGNTATVTTNPLPGSGTFTFNVAADSYVDESAPTANHGTASTLRIDASPPQISYLRFDLSGVIGSVSSV
ncbi:MAG TPA: Ig-like domain-containing protein, partial [Candidatus Limnocylindrales bacterium]|nr:Ig-like domain-containing protein [Candidatus Limnocylindrales bacterium]